MVENGKSLGFQFNFQNFSSLNIERFIRYCNSIRFDELTTISSKIQQQWISLENPRWLEPIDQLQSNSNLFNQAGKDYEELSRLNSMSIENTDFDRLFFVGETNKSIVICHYWTYRPLDLYGHILLQDVEEVTGEDGWDLVE